jgi:hypothetical protein
MPQGLIEEIVSRRTFLSPKFSKSIFNANRKNLINFEQRRDGMKIQRPTKANRAKESNGDAISGLARPLAAEIVMPPFSTGQKTFVASKRYKMPSVNDTQ